MSDTIQTGLNTELSLDIDLPDGLQFLDRRHWFKFTVGETAIGPINPERVTVARERYSVHVCFSLTPDEAAQYFAAQQRYRDAHPYIPDPDENVDDEFVEED